MAAGESDLSRRRAGVCLHLTSLPGPGGIGEFGAPARYFMDWMQAQQLSVWQFLPTGPTGYGNSPYQPLSVFAGNPLLIDLHGLCEWGLLRPDEIVTAAGESDSQVDYERVAAFKLPQLVSAAARFTSFNDSMLRSGFELFCERHDRIWLDGFATFVMLKALNGNLPWPAWTAKDQTAKQHQVDEVRTTYAEELERIKVVQFFYYRQWRELQQEARRRELLLFGDVPIYMALDCAEAWARPQLLELNEDLIPNEVAGVPPDYFSADGQLWGNPVYRWSAHAADGFSWWIQRLRHALDTADMVRLDHFRAFDEFWSVPYGAATAREGRWRTGPGAALFDALADALGTVPFIAEDLGIITDSVIALRKAYGLPGMQVLQFLVDQPQFDLGSIEEDCVCYTGTHDNDTTVGWFAGGSGSDGAALAEWQDVIRRNVEYAGDSINKALIRMSCRSAARVSIAPLQDFLGLDSSARLNTPGQPHGNWRWRTTAAELDSGDSDYIGALVRETNRS